MISNLRTNYFILIKYNETCNFTLVLGVRPVFVFQVSRLTEQKYFSGRFKQEAGNHRNSLALEPAENDILARVSAPACSDQSAVWSK